MLLLNGIFNEEPSAAVYADQHGVERPGDTPVDRTQYFIHFEKADNLIAELVVAGYQKFIEGDFWGLTNATGEVADMMQLYGRSGLHLDGHSRGSMTIGNAIEWLMDQPNSGGQLGRTTINFFGPAESVARTDANLAILQNRQGVSDINTYNDMVLHYQNHASDPVGRLLTIGNNPSTGGTNRENKNIFGDAFGEALNALGGHNTVHNCYGNSRPWCKGIWMNFQNDRPVLIPVTTYKASGSIQ